MDETTVTMEIQIGGRNYPLRVLSSEKEKIENAARLLNQRMDLYEKNFSVKDKQDVLAMTLLNFAAELASYQQSDSNHKQFLKQVQDTELYLSTYLNNIVL